MSPRPSERELRELGRDFFDEEDEALLEHVLGDDERPPQGLHQRGFKGFGEPPVPDQSLHLEVGRAFPAQGEVREPAELRRAGRLKAEALLGDAVEFAFAEWPREKLVALAQTLRRSLALVEAEIARRREM